MNFLNKKEQKLSLDFIKKGYLINKVESKASLNYINKVFSKSVNSILGKKVKIGNFVEVKNSKIGDGSKINHLTYIGDSIIGSNTNIGAGTITCNYDGYKKNKTIISDNVFIGSNSSLVAPIKINKKSVIGAGSVITKDVKENSLALERSEQREIENYNRKK